MHLLFYVAEHVGGEVLDELVVKLLICIPWTARNFLCRSCQRRRRAQSAGWSGLARMRDDTTPDDEARDGGRGRLPHAEKENEGNGPSGLCARSESDHKNEHKLSGIKGYLHTRICIYFVYTWYALRPEADEVDPNGGK